MKGAAALVRRVLKNLPPLFRGGVGAFAVQGGGVVVAALIQVLLTRTLGADQFGDYYYVLSWVTFLSLVGLLGFDTLSLRMIAAYRAVEQWDRLHGFLRFGAGLCVAGATLLAAVFAAVVIAFPNSLSPGFVATALFGACLLPLLAASKLCLSWLLGLRRAVPGLVVATVLQPLLFGGLALTAFYLVHVARTARIAMGLQLLATAAAAMVMVALVRRLVPPAAWVAKPIGVRKEWLRSAGPHLAIGMSQVLLVQVDSMMVGLLVSPREAGIFGVAAKLASLVGFAISAVNAVVAPAMAELHSRGDDGGLKRVVGGAATATLGYALAIGGVLALWRVPVLGLFGGDFQVGAGPMLLLITSQIVAAAYGSIGFLLTMTGHEGPASRTIVSAAATDIALNWLLIPRFGLIGAAAATLIAVVTRNLWLGALARRHLGIRPLWLIFSLGR